MKPTGYIRRIDYLGRIVIPKELRAKLFKNKNEFEGKPLEFFIDGNSIILKKYEDEVSAKEYAFEQICKMIASGDISKEVYDKYLSDTKIGFMNEEDLKAFLGN